MADDRDRDESKGSPDPETLYTKEFCIGGGSFGKVYKGVDKRSGQAVAIKVIDIESADDEVDDIIQEIAILSGLRSPHVTKYYGSYAKNHELWIVMEFCSGGSYADLMKPGKIGEEYIAIIMRELLLGLEYLHGDKKLHRDIKAANVLLTSTGQVKLADFGVSGQLSATMTKKNTFVGTPFWMAPEVIKQSGYDYRADIWSLAITAMELANGEPPYADIHPMKVLFLIPKNPPPRLEGNFTKAFKDFIEICLQRDPKDRPSARDLLKHPFIRKARKSSYLTELIERHQRWAVHHRSRDDDDEPVDDRVAKADYLPVNEDMWDFGTVRMVGGAGKGGGLVFAEHRSGLNAMGGAATNARASRTSESSSDYGEEPRDQSPSKMSLRRDLETLKPGGGASRQNSPQRPPVPLMAPTSPTKVPLPPSPMKGAVLPRPETPKASSLQPAPPQVRDGHSPDYDRILQEQLQRDMGAMGIAHGISSGNSRPSSNQATPSSQNAPMPARGIIIPDIPPFRGGPQNHKIQQQQQQRQQPQSPQHYQQQHRLPNLGSQQPLPEMQPRVLPPSIPQQQPLPPPIPQHALFKMPSKGTLAKRSMGRAAAISTSSTFIAPPPGPLSPTRSQPPQHQSPRSAQLSQFPLPPSTQHHIPPSPSTSSPSTASNPNTSIPLFPLPPQPTSLPTEPDALNEVVLTSLEAALSRRDQQVREKHRDGLFSAAQQRASEANQRKIAQLVFSVGRACQEIDRLDKVDGVGMGFGIGSFFEGLLEEVLIRTDPVVDDDDDGA